MFIKSARSVIRHLVRRCLFLATAAAIAACGSEGLVTSSVAAPNYFNGKSIRLLIGAPAGGGYDLYARLLAEYLPRYLPGNPHIIPENMPGGGSLHMADYIYAEAPSDGTVIGIGGGSLATAGLFKFPGAFYDSRRFSWIGSMSSAIGVTVAWAKSPVTTTQDLFTKDFVVGGAGAAADSVQFPTAVNRILGTRFKIITGYPGSPQIAQAMEDGEVQGMGNWNYASVVASHEQWLKERKIRILLQLGLTKLSDLPDVPTVLDMAHTKQQADLLRLVFTQQAIGRPVIGAPGESPTITKLYQKAFMAMMNDSNFKAEAKQHSIEITNPTDGPDTLKLISELYQYDPTLIKHASEAMVVTAAQ
jgi:tripartite-type tricarboxylate transporter receptor subunit TctC